MEFRPDSLFEGMCADTCWRAARTRRRGLEPGSPRGARHRVRVQLHRPPTTPGPRCSPPQYESIPSTPARGRRRAALFHHAQPPDFGARLGAFLWHHQSIQGTLFRDAIRRETRSDSPGSETAAHRFVGSAKPGSGKRQITSEAESIITLFEPELLKGCARNFIGFRNSIRQGRGPSHRVLTGEK